MTMFGREQCDYIQQLVRHVKVSPRSRYFILEESSGKGKSYRVVPVEEGALLQLFAVLDRRVMPQNARVYAAWHTGVPGESWRLLGPYGSLLVGAREVDRVLKDSGSGAHACLGRVYPLTTGSLCLLATMRFRPRRRARKVDVL